MSFTPYIPSTTMYASITNDNFQYLGAWNLMPHENTISVIGGITYTFHVAIPTAGGVGESSPSYNIGSSTYTVKTIYCQQVRATNIVVSGSVSTADKSLLYFLQLDTQITSASRIEITGLNGDNVSQYDFKIIGKFNSTGSTNINCVLNFNGDSGASYGYHYFRQSQETASTSSLSSERVQGANNIPILYGRDTATAVLAWSFGYIFANANKQRIFFGKDSAIDNANANTSSSFRGIMEHFDRVGIWNNEADTLSSIVITSATTTQLFNSGTAIILWGRR